MFYGSTKLLTDWSEKELNDWKSTLLYALLFFIPKANPDNERLYHLVDTWLLEVDEHGRPTREVALNEDGEPIFSAPDERNFGFWTDSPDTVPPGTLLPIDKEHFETMWHRVARSG